MNIKFSIVIPTYNRDKYLDHTLRSCELQKYQNVEFLIVDDASTDNTESVVSKYTNSDSRFNYTKHVHNVGMLQNFEYGIKQTTGDYIMALGSDDALMPNALEQVSELISQTGTNLITWPTAAYIYSGTKKIQTAQIVMRRKNYSKKLKVINSSEYLSRQARDLHYVADEDCPMIYVKSFASRNLIEKIKERSGGRFYKCSTPDGYSGIVLAGEVPEFHKYDFPLSIHGVSPNSTGTNYLFGSSDCKDINLTTKFFVEATSRPLHAELGGLPYSPLISIMTADFLYTASDLPGWSGKYHPIDKKKLVNCALDEICDGLMLRENALRELGTLRSICKENNLLYYYQEIIQKKFRNKRKILVGNAISPKRIYYNATDLMIENVNQAAEFISNHKSVMRTLSLVNAICMLGNSIRYFFYSKQKQEPLSKIDSDL